MALRKLFLGNLCIKNMKPSLRVVLFSVTALCTMTAFIPAFRWFPPSGLLVFIFGSICAIIVNAVRMFRREEAKNKELADALEQYKSAHNA